jgi:hypothetical protein
MTDAQADQTAMRSVRSPVDEKIRSFAYVLALRAARRETGGPLAAGVAMSNPQ